MILFGIFNRIGYIWKRQGRNCYGTTLWRSDCRFQRPWILLVSPNTRKAQPPKPMMPGERSLNYAGSSACKCGGTVLARRTPKPGSSPCSILEQESLFVQVYKWVLETFESNVAMDYYSVQVGSQSNTISRGRGRECKRHHHVMQTQSAKFSVEIQKRNIGSIFSYYCIYSYRMKWQNSNVDVATIVTTVQCNSKYLCSFTDNRTSFLI